MAVYEHKYKSYDGMLTAAWSRFLVIPRYAYQDLFRYKIFTALFALCFVCPLVFVILIYLRHNATVLLSFGVDAGDLLQIGVIGFYVFTVIQTSFAFICTVIIGPVLISRDLANNALPLYLSRPFSRLEYIVGKMSILLILLSLITWVPGLLLFAFQAYLEGGDWLSENIRIANAIFLVSLANIGILTMMAVAFSASIKWRTAASAALFAIFIIPTPIGFIIQEIFGTNIGHLLNLGMALNMLSWGLFDINREIRVMSLNEALMVIAVYALICFYLLWRKVRAYEVVSS
jgi:ABC-2 type transport system permease protein